MIQFLKIGFVVVAGGGGPRGLLPLVGVCVDGVCVCVCVCVQVGREVEPLFGRCLDSK